MIQKRSFIKYLQYNFTDTTGIDSFDTELIANLYIFSPANYATLCICNDRNKNYSSGHHCQASVQVKQAGVERGRERDGKVVRRTEEYWGGKWGGCSVSDRDSSGYHCLLPACYYGTKSAPDSPETETSIAQSHFHC